MTENIRVTCLLNRYWNPEIRKFDGTECSGTMIDICMKSAEEDPGKLIPAGVVLLDDNTFQSVPMEFITKI